uniref:Transp_Tc5_C domain-containing protein n=1 Tax=Heterorhabditis bacteriophora TaxID=37862 RepID=A0A1I7W7C2_HETBA
MAAYVPAPVSFRPSQQRGHDIAFYPLPGQSKLAYEFAFHSINKAKTIMTYCCCTCRALKDGARSAFGKIPYVHIVNGNFITDPEILVNPHSARQEIRLGLQHDVKP